jgi:Kef-type K+ transport system membrane component KefB
VEPAALRTLVLIVAIATLSPVLADSVKRFLRLPAVVIEIVLGIVIGHQVLDWVHESEALHFLAEFGLVLLIFLAGFEIEPERVRGKPTSLALVAWVSSLVLGIGLATLLHALDITSGIRFVAIALTTTAIGALLPILGDAGVLPTRFGAFVLASGAMGEFGPIIAISLALATDDPGRTAVVLVAFGAVAVLAAWLASRPARPRIVRLIGQTLHSSGQLGVRIAMLICMLLVWFAASSGLDVLLGAFAAGVVVRLFLTRHAAEDEPEPTTTAGARAAAVHRPDHLVEVQHRIEAIGFGFFIPLFFVVSGTHFDIAALGHPGTLLKVPMFLLLFVVVRGLPAWWYRHELDRPSVIALGLLHSAALPLVVVITTIGTDTGRMRPDNAAAMVGAGLVSVVVLPLVGLGFLRRSASPASVSAVVTEPA